METCDTKRHKLLRDAVVTEMQVNLKEPLQGYMSRNVAQYCEESGISNDGVWATDAEILGAASLIGHDIVVFSRSGDSYKWLRYTASLNFSTTTAETILLRNVSEHFEPVLKCMKKLY